MRKKKYGWKGWKMPILHLDDPDYCEYGCPICTNARKGNRLARVIQGIEIAITFGGCPWGRARKKKCGVKPKENMQFSSIDGQRRHQRIKFGFQVEDKDGKKIWMTEDISAGGCFIHASDRPLLGSRINIVFQIPGSSRHIESTGVVKRLEEKGMGVAFTDIGDEEKDEMERFVKDFMNRIKLQDRNV